MDTKTNRRGSSTATATQPNNNGNSATANNKHLTDQPGQQPQGEQNPPEPKGEANPSEVKGEVKAETEKKEAPKVLSVDDKIRKVELLNEAIEKRNLLKNHLSRVEALKFGDFEEKESITISGQGGNYVIKGGSSLNKEIATLVKTRIEERIELVEEQICF